MKALTRIFVKLNQFLSDNQVEFKYTFKDGLISEQRKDNFSGYFYEELEDSKDLIKSYVKSPIHITSDDNGNEIKFINDKYNVANTSKMQSNQNGFCF